jgi:hypothetical protein
VKTKLKLEILPQPNDTTCGPTCLHAVYGYYGDGIPLHRVINEVPSLKTGGTLGVMLANHALRRGYRATIYTYNLKLFDPTWFILSTEEICKRLKRQARFKKRDKLQRATRAYIDFLELGGVLKMEDLTARLLRKYLNRGIPILTGLSSTYLYQAVREYGPHDRDDDIRGQPAGHFVVLRGYDRKKRTVFVADPLESNPYSSDHQYELGINRVMNAILLSIVTDDANLMILEPNLPALPD